MHPHFLFIYLTISILGSSIIFWLSLKYTLRFVPSNKLAAQNEVKSVSVKGKHGNVQFANASIESVDFKSHIVEEKETKQVYMGTTLGVCSPVLISGHGKKWKGIFNGKVIEFAVEDKSFQIGRAHV